MSLTWRSNWISCFESPISVFDKLCFANEISQNEFHRYFKGELNLDHYNPLLSQLDYNKIQDAIADHELLLRFQSSIYRLSHIFENGDEFPQMYFSKDLYQCNFCSLDGYHSLLFQSKLVVECPFHNIPLTNLCRNCGSPLKYKYYKGQGITQCCPICYEPILKHTELYPNYKIYTEQQINSTNVLYEFLHLNEREIARLQRIYIQGSHWLDKYERPEFLLYCLRIDNN